MSTMLEQAIVDAQALRETALRTAEQAVIEKYSTQIKEAVETLLEQPVDPMEEEDPMAMDPMMMDDPAAAEETDPLVDELPLAAHDGEKLCACPEDPTEAEPDGKNKTVLVVDFSKLSREMSGESDEELPEPMQPAGMALQEGLEEEIDLDEASLEDIVEALTVDIKPTPSGWGNNGYPDAMLNLAKEELLALAQDSEEKERLEALNKAIEKLQESNDKLNITLNEKDKKISGLSQHLVMFKEKLEEVGLLNAKLLYTNKALASNSLNERQKKYIAESLLNAKSAEETKALYETLQNAVGRDARKQSESLSEVVGRKVSSTMILSSNRKKTESPVDSTTNRWKTLAGINKTN
jgi:hypothetical protein